jgi:competence protein ComEC
MFYFITPIGLGWLAGTTLQLQQAQLWSAANYQTLFAASLWLAFALLLTTRHEVWFSNTPSSQAILYANVGRCAWCVVSATLAFAQVGWRATHFQASALSPVLEGQTLLLTGVVSAMPQRTEDSVRFPFEVQTARTAKDDEVMVPPLVMLGWYGARAAGAEVVDVPPDIQAGDQWQFQVRLKAPHGHINPHGFDLELWLWEQGLQASGYVRNGKRDVAPKFLGNTGVHPVERLRQKVRSRVLQQVSEHRSAGVIAALLVGDQAAIERADWDVFRITGVAHLMAISGLHITGLAWLASMCVGWLWRRSDVLWPQRPLTLWLSAPLAGQALGCVVAFAYALFSGWGLPAQRTVWMLLWVLLLRWQGHRWPWPQVWLWVCALVLAIDPWALMQAGFWLSFVAVGVLFASGREEPFVQTGVESGWGTSVLEHLIRMGREQWLMSVCLAPLTLLLFNQVSVVGLFANLLAVPWVTLVVTPFCLLGLLIPQAWDIAAWGLQALMMGLAHAAAVPWAQWSAPSAPVWVNASALFGMALWVLRLPWWIRAFSAPMVAVMLSWQVKRPPMGEFELLAADMGQGHAVLVRTATHALLYDTGPRYSSETDAGQRVLVPMLRALGEQLNRVIISHQDSDHSGGAPAVLAMQPQADVLTSMSPEHPLRLKYPMHTCMAGQEWTWDGVHFSMLHPLEKDYSRGLLPNANSCVLRLQSASGQVALLVGDIEAAQERELLARHNALKNTFNALMQSPLKATWLLVPHHGSATSSTPEFLQAVQPDIALVQAGYRNRYGHPRADVMARYDDIQALVVQTTRCGASKWQSERPIMVHCARDEQQRYWHHRLP